MQRVFLGIHLKLPFRDLIERSIESQPITHIGHITASRHFHEDYLFLPTSKWDGRYTHFHFLCLNIIHAIPIKKGRLTARMNRLLSVVHDLR